MRNLVIRTYIHFLSIYFQTSKLTVDIGEPFPRNSSSDRFYCFGVAARALLDDELKPPTQL